jgi:hypothetical protein
MQIKTGQGAAAKSRHNAIHRKALARESRELDHQWRQTVQY